MQNKRQIAVITGDIVNSSTLKEEQQKTIQKRFIELAGKDALLKPKFYRGDSFQMAVKPETALSLVIKFRIELRRVNESNDVRASIGIGEISSWNENVLLSGGSAFERSGKKLDELKKKGLRIVITTGNPELDEELETYCVMADSLLNGLTTVQANVASYKLDGLSQERIAEILKITQPSVSKTLKAANWKAIEKFIKRYRQIIEKNYGTSE
jgi:hypothetical protein